MRKRDSHFFSFCRNSREHAGPSSRRFRGGPRTRPFRARDAVQTARDACTKPAVVDERARFEPFRARNRALWTPDTSISPDSMHAPRPRFSAFDENRRSEAILPSASFFPGLHNPRKRARKPVFSALGPENVHNPRIGAQARGLPAKRKSWRRMGRGRGEAERERSGDVAGLGVRWERNPNGSGAVRDEGGIGAGARLDRERSESVPDWG